MVMAGMVLIPAMLGDDCSDAVTTNYGKSQPDGFYIHPELQKRSPSAHV